MRYSETGKISVASSSLKPTVFSVHIFVRVGSRKDTTASSSLKSIVSSGYIFVYAGSRKNFCGKLFFETHRFLSSHFRLGRLKKRYCDKLFFETHRFLSSHLRSGRFKKRYCGKLFFEIHRFFRLYLSLARLKEKILWQALLWKLPFPQFMSSFGQTLIYIDVLYEDFMTNSIARKIHCILRDLYKMYQNSIIIHRGVVSEEDDVRCDQTSDIARSQWRKKCK